MMNSKMSRSIKSKKTSSLLKAEDQTLKAETSKIQNKLQSLKAQIAMRKTMKNKEKQSDKTLLKATQKNNTGQSWTQLSRTSNSKLNPQASEKNSKALFTMLKQTDHDEVNQDRLKLNNLLKQLNMEPFKDLVIDKYGVDGLHKLLSLQEEDIDQWKSIPIGFRIKLKKFIKQHDKRKGQRNLNPDDAGEQIEAIIQRRKTEKIYEPIRDKKFDEQDEQQIIEMVQAQEQANRELADENEQDILISSLNSAFLQRRGIIKKTCSSESINSSHSKNKVSWDSKVVEYNKETSNYQTEKLMTKHPKANKKHEGYGTDQRDGRVGYCWQCLKKISSMEREQQFEQYDQGVHRTFCNNKCRSKYEKKTNLKIPSTEEVNDGLAEKEEQMPESDVEELDLELF